MAGDVLLIHPPIYQPTEPPPGISALMASARAAGFDGSVLDLNLRFFERTMRRSTLSTCLDRASRRLDVLDRMGSLSGERLLEYVPLLQHAALVDLPDRIEDDVDVFRDERFYDPARYCESVRSVTRALGLVSATIAPFEVRFDRVHSHVFDLDVSADLYAAVDEFLSMDANIAREIFEDELRSACVESFPVVGISVTYPAQFLFGMVVAALVRRLLPDAFLVLGGPYVASVAKQAHRVGRHPLFREADAVAISDGDVLFPQLLEAVRSGRGVTPMPNLLLYDRSSETATLENVDVVTDLDALPVADFTDFDLERYWTPTPVLPMPVARGCYWDKCTFCYYGFVPDGRRATAPYRERSVDRIVEDLTILRERHGCRHFDFTVDLVAPTMLDRLAAKIVQANLDVRWGLEARAERSFTRERCDRLKAGGMTYAEFGMESMDQSVLDGIQKGTKVDQYADVLRNFHGAGIATAAMGFFDFPTEDGAAARRSIEFLSSNSEVISEIAWGNFVLDVGSQVHRSPSKFGIREVIESPDADLALSASYHLHHTPKTEGDRQAVEDALVTLVEELCFPTELTRPFVGGGTGEAHTFLYYDRYGPDAVKWFGRQQRQSRAEASIADELRPRFVIRQLALRYPVEELCAKFDELTRALQIGRGEAVVELGPIRSKRERLRTWNDRETFAPDADACMVAATPGVVAVLREDLSRALAQCAGDRDVRTILDGFPDARDELRDVFATAVGLGWIEVREAMA